MLKTYQTLTCTLFLLPAIAFAQNSPNALLTGKADEAFAALRTRLQIAPADAEAHNLMCRVYYQLERWDDSVHACERAVNLQPHNGEYHQWLGRAYGRRVEASGPVGALFMVRKVKAEFERAVALNADNLSARSDLAEFYTEAPFFMGGDKTKARQLAVYVAQRDPAQGQFILAQIDEKKNKPKAETEFKSAVLASGGRADYWFELASFYRRSGRPEEMQLAVDKASDLSSKDPIALFFCGRLLLNAGSNYPAAVQMLRAYLSSGNFGEDGPEFLAHYILGSLLERQGDTTSAAAEFRSALALASLYKPARDALARVTR